MRFIRVLSAAAVLPIALSLAPSVASARAAAPASVAASAALAATTVPGGLVPLPSHRLVDTRYGTGAPKAAVAAGSSLAIDVTGREGIPDGVSTVALTVTAVGPTGNGYLSVHAHGTPAPTASSVNFAVGQTVPNLVLAQVSAEGLVDVTVGGSGSVHVIVDVAGYVAPGAVADAGALTSVAPARLLDTRFGVGAPKAAVAGGAKVTLAVAGHGGVPASGAGSVIVNVTATAGTAVGYVTVAPVISGAVTTSSLNYAKGQTRANLVVVPLSPTGSIDLKVTSGGSAQLIADVVGWLRDGTPSADGTAKAVTPTRVLDTRESPDGPLTNQGAAVLKVTGQASVPATGVAAVALNVTATQATAPGHVAALPTASNLETGSNLNFVKGRDEANLVIVPVSPEGFISLRVTTSGSVHLVADVAGYVLGSPADTTPPGQVADLAVTYPTKNSIALTWTNPTDADFAGVTIRRITDGDAPNDPLAGEVVAQSTGTSFVDANLTPGTKYGYTVWARDFYPNIQMGVQTTATTTALTWGAPQSVAPFVGGSSAVACPATNWCMAVDWSGQAQIWNGSTWSARVKVMASDPQYNWGGLHDVTCPSSTFCVARAEQQLFAYRNGSWGAFPTLPSAGEMGWADIDCVSATFCVAVGGGGLVSKFDGVSWGAPIKTSGAYFSVDCASTTFCAAVGTGYSGLDNFAARFNGTTWAVGRLPSGTSSIYDVSCVSATYCLATGSDMSTRWNGSSWTAPVSVNSGGWFQGRSVSCTATTFCVAFDPQLGTKKWNGSSWGATTSLSAAHALNGDLACRSTTCVVVDQHGRYSRFNGTSWSTMATFDPTSGIIASLSCPTVTSCLAGDQNGTVHRWTGGAWTHTALGLDTELVACATDTWCMATDPTRGQARIYNGAWSAPMALPGHDDNASCPVAGWCMSVDAEGNVRTWTGTQWSAPKAVLTGPADWGGKFIDCSGKTHCMAVSGNAYWSRWNGVSWSAPRRISAGIDYIDAVACASPTLCLVSNYDGTTYRFDGASWTLVSTAQSVVSQIYDLTCPAENFCAAAQSGVIGGSLAIFNGRTWNKESQPLNLPTNTTFQIECPALYTCVVASPDQVMRSS